MHIVHLLSNYKWTERSEPVVDLVLGQRKLGAESTLLCGKSRMALEDSIAYQSRRRGLDPVLLELPKHFRWRKVVPDIIRMRRLLRANPAEILHCHMPNAHLTAALCVKGISPKPLVVNSLYDPGDPNDDFRFRRICLPGTDGFITISDDGARRLMDLFGVDAERIEVIEPSIDLKRFGDPGVERKRRMFALREDDFVVGMVSAFGPRRRIDITLRAVKLLAARIPELKCLLIGRGKVWDMIEKPAMELGISDRIILGGYCRDKRLVSAYRAMDLLAYPMPGTDKSCRTVREAMASGLPVIAARTGFLPQLLKDGVTGRLVGLSPESMAEAIESLYRDREKLLNIGRNAMAEARERFSPSLQAERTMEFYSRLREMGGQ